MKYTVHEEALSEAKDAYGDEAPDFYDAQQKFFEENDKQYILGEMGK